MTVDQPCGMTTAHQAHAWDIEDISAFRRECPGVSGEQPPSVEDARAEADPYLVDRHLAHVEAAVEDYRTVFPEPHALSVNLALAVEGARLLAASRAVPSDRDGEGR